MIESSAPAEQSQWRERLRRIEESIRQVDPAKPDFTNVVIGIEITIPGFRGPNLDHHRPGDNENTPSAIKQAVELDLSKIPQQGQLAILKPAPELIGITKPDADSVGAIAVLLSRREDRRIDPGLVEAIDTLDRLGPVAYRQSDEFEPYRQKIQAFGQLMSQRKPLPELVLFMQRLLEDKADPEEISQLALERERTMEKAKTELKIEPFASGRAVYVEGTNRGAFALGYEYAEVVVAFNPEYIPYNDPEAKPMKKFTIGKRGEEINFDLPAVFSELNNLEVKKGGRPGWGGRSTIGGSGLEVETVLSAEEVKRVVAESW